MGIGKRLYPDLAASPNVQTKDDLLHELFDLRELSLRHASWSVQGENNIHVWFPASYKARRNAGLEMLDLFFDIQHRLDKKIKIKQISTMVQVSTVFPKTAEKKFKKKFSTIFPFSKTAEKKFKKKKFCCFWKNGGEKKILLFLEKRWRKKIVSSHLHHRRYLSNTYKRIKWRTQWLNTIHPNNRNCSIQ